MGRYAVMGCKLQVPTKHYAYEGCKTCASLAGLVTSFIASFIASFIVVVIAP